MYVLFRYPVGVVVEGVVLANGKNRMRIAAAGFGDTIELKRSGSNWISADRQCVEVEFLMSSSGTICNELALPVEQRQVMTFASAN
jgi:hypothetical protein